jgi:hypothetical protein
MLLENTLSTDKGGTDVRSLWCEDSAALYTGGWDTAGLEWHHNWIHDATEKCARADDQSRNMSVHHNVSTLANISVSA